MPPKKRTRSKSPTLHLHAAPDTEAGLQLGDDVQSVVATADWLTRTTTIEQHAWHTFVKRLCDAPAIRSGRAAYTAQDLDCVLAACCNFVNLAADASTVLAHPVVCQLRAVLSSGSNGKQLSAGKRVSQSQLTAQQQARIRDLCVKVWQDVLRPLLFSDQPCESVHDWHEVLTKVVNAGCLLPLVPPAFLASSPPIALDGMSAVSAAERGCSLLGKILAFQRSEGQMPAETVSILFYSAEADVTVRLKTTVGDQCSFIHVSAKRRPNDMDEHIGVLFLADVATTLAPPSPTASLLHPLGAKDTGKQADGAGVVTAAAAAAAGVVEEVIQPVMRSEDRPAPKPVTATNTATSAATPSQQRPAFAFLKQEPVGHDYMNSTPKPKRRKLDGEDAAVAVPSSRPTPTLTSRSPTIPQPSCSAAVVVSCGAPSLKQMSRMESPAAPAAGANPAPNGEAAAASAPAGPTCTIDCKAWRSVWTGDARLQDLVLRTKTFITLLGGRCTCMASMLEAAPFVGSIPMCVCRCGIGSIARDTALVYGSDPLSGMATHRGLAGDWAQWDELYCDAVWLTRMLCSGAKRECAGGDYHPGSSAPSMLLTT